METWRSSSPSHERSSSPGRSVSPMNSSKRTSPDTNKKKHPRPAPIPLPDDPDVSFKLNEKTNHWTISSASLEKLIICLYHPRISDPNLMETFLVTFRTLIPPSDLLTELLSRASGSEFSLPKDVYFVQKRILKFIHKWVGLHPYDFASRLTRTLKDFTREKIPASEPILHRYGERIVKRLNSMPQKDTFGRESRARSDPVTMASAMANLTFAVTHVTPREIAEQLTYLESQMFSAIEPREWTELKWQKSRSPHITAFVDQFNRVSAWVAGQIVDTQTLEKRLLVLSHFIQTAKLLRRLQNFNGAIEVLAGLDCISVSRLKETWAVLPSKDKAVFDDLKVMLGIQSNFKAYRQLLASASPPAIPHIGMVLKDLVAASESVPETFEDLINVDRLRMITRIIQDTRAFSQPYPNLHPDKDLQAYLEFQLDNEIDDEQLYERSLQIQPYGESDEASKREQARAKKFRKVTPTRLPSAHYETLLGMEVAVRDKRSASMDHSIRRSWEALPNVRTSQSESDSSSGSSSFATAHSSSSNKSREKEKGSSKEKLVDSEDFQGTQNYWI